MRVWGVGVLGSGSGCRVGFTVQGLGFRVFSVLGPGSFLLIQKDFLQRLTKLYGILIVVVWKKF